MSHALVVLGASPETSAACVDARLAFRGFDGVEDAAESIPGNVVLVELPGPERVATIAAMGAAWVVSIVDDAAEAVRALAAGADEVIVRPVRVTDLVLRTEPRRDFRRVARGVAHELNNLLSVIGGCASFLGAELPEDDPLRRDVTHIQRAAQQAESLARRLLALGRREVRKATEVDLADLLRSMRPALRRALGAHILLRIDARAVPTVRIDRESFEQILLELATQMHQSMPGGATVSIRTSPRTIDADTAARHGIAASEYVSLSITAPRLPRIAFVSAEVGKAGGCVLVEETAMSILLAPSEEMPKLSAPATLLLVDDDPVVRNVVRRSLEQAGFTVLAAAGPAEAVELAERHDGEIDVLLTDVLMPGMNGMQLARCVEQFRASISVVYMTGHAAMVRSLGSATVLPKPIDPHELIATLQAVLATRVSR
ncbi:MAG: response regulator [Polyangiales bacterium]